MKQVLLNVMAGENWLARRSWIHVTCAAWQRAEHRPWRPGARFYPRSGIAVFVVENELWVTFQCPVGWSQMSRERKRTVYRTYGDVNIVGLSCQTHAGEFSFDSNPPSSSPHALPKFPALQKSEVRLRSICSFAASWLVALIRQRS